MMPLDARASLDATDAAVHRVRLMVVRVFAAIFACILVFAAAALSLRYVEAVGDGRREVNNLADLLAEYVVIRLRGIDGALSRISADNRRLGGPEGSEREWASAMRAAIAGVPGLSSLVVLDANGVVRHATVQQIRGLSWADRPIFQELARGIPNQLVVSPPVTMVAGDQVLVPFGRALTGPRGDFIGAVIAMLLPRQLRDFLGTFDLGRSGIAWVLLPSGDVLFRDGAIGELSGIMAEERPLFASDRAPAGDGFVSRPLFSDGPDYLTAYRQSTVGGLVVAVSFANQSFLSRWRYEAIGALIIVVVAGLLLFLAARRIRSATLDIVAAADAESAPHGGIAATRPAE